MMFPQVNAVIALLSVEGIQLDMTDLTKCIGGHCVNHLHEDPSYSGWMGVDQGFMRVSGIENPILADMVCFPKVVGSYEATVPQAIKMLEYLRDTGIVDWAKALS